MKNLATRVLIGIIGIPLILFLSFVGDLPFALLIALIAALGQYEFYALLLQRHVFSFATMAILLGFCWVVLTLYLSVQSLFIVLMLIFTIFFLIMLFRQIDNIGLNLSTTVAGFVYIPLFLSTLILLRQLPAQLGLADHQGWRLILLLFICVWLCDTLAYLIGSWLGRRSLAPNISPRKSIIGSLAGIGGALIGVLALALVNWTPAFLNRVALIVFALLVGVFAQLGDLIESMIKRDAKVKDSGVILLGHGGILDRFDALMITAPIIYLYINVFILR